MELVVSREFKLQTFDKQCVFQFEEGIPGFEKAAEWIVFSNPTEDPFAWLQSVSIPDLSFVVVDPWVVCPSYTPRVSDYDAARLGIKKPEDAMLLVIVSVKEKIEEMTANLIGPILLNVHERKGAQVVLQNCMDYTSHYRILDGLSQNEPRQASGSGH